MATRVLSRIRGGAGESVRRVDAIPKVTGTFDYASDLRADAMLWGATLRSPRPHARIRRIDTAAAASLPGVHAVLLAADLPGKRTFGLNFDDQPVLADGVVRYHGEPVAVIAADTAAIARQAATRAEPGTSRRPVARSSRQRLSCQASCRAWAAPAYRWWLGARSR